MIEQLVLGMVGTNTWLIKNKETNELLIIDPADDAAGGGGGRQRAEPADPQ